MHPAGSKAKEAHRHHCTLHTGLSCFFDAKLCSYYMLSRYGQERRFPVALPDIPGRCGNGTPRETTLDWNVHPPKSLPAARAHHCQKYSSGLDHKGYTAQIPLQVAVHPSKRIEIGLSHPVRWYSSLPCTAGIGLLPQPHYRILVCKEYTSPSHSPQPPVQAHMDYRPGSLSFHDWTCRAHMDDRPSRQSSVGIPQLGSSHSYLALPKVAWSPGHRLDNWLCLQGRQCLPGIGYTGPHRWPHSRWRNE
mmetsp:Transcript_5372/g.11363  ORF Transcript_5372/g.11363 Transcript_5372/m.11363 type:complete len:248 (+) Transcript_5372:2428-3171(+)